MVVHQGGTSCFGPDTLVSTPNGPKKIKDFVVGDSVNTYDANSENNCVSVVSKVYSFQNTKPTIRVKMKDGREIIATEDHEFYFQGGWYSLKHILYLRDQLNKRE
jgi:intein/homing endonuclease